MIQTKSGVKLGHELNVKLAKDAFAVTDDGNVFSRPALPGAAVGYWDINFTAVLARGGAVWIGLGDRVCNPDLADFGFVYTGRMIFGGDDWDAVSRHAASHIAWWVTCVVHDLEWMLPPADTVMSLIGEVA